MFSLWETKGSHGVRWRSNAETVAMLDRQQSGKIQKYRRERNEIDENKYN